MAKSRYSGTPIIDNHHFAPWRLPIRSMGLKGNDLLSGVQTVDYVVRVGDRIDQLASRFLHDESYWWVIALVNDISYPFASGGFSAGVTLHIPVNVNDVLGKILP
jgi:hypothetical protein